jgi:hypothetical protein
VPYGTRNQSVDFANFDWPREQEPVLRYKRAKQMEEEDYDFVTIRTDLLTANNPMGRNRSVTILLLYLQFEMKIFSN